MCHRLEDRVKAHVLICMLSCYLSWHLRKAWAALTYIDEHPPQRDNATAPAHRSASAEAKASRKATTTGQPVRCFRDLLDHPRHPHPPDHYHRRPPDQEDHHPHPSATAGV